MVHLGFCRAGRSSSIPDPCVESDPDDPAEPVFLDLAPFPTGEDEEFISAWAAVIMTDADELLGTFINEMTGELLAEFEPLHEGLEQR